MTEALKTQVCRSCGKELPLTEYRNTRIGLLKTCKECVRQNQIRAKLAKKQEVSAEQELAKARHLRISDFTPRELMSELKRRGYEFTMKYTEVHIIDSKDIK